MIPNRPNAPHDTPIAPRITLQSSGQWNVSARPAPPSAATLGTPSATTPTVPLDLFVPAEAPVTLEIQRAPSAVLGDPAQPSVLALKYTPPQEAAYALLQEVQTSNGVIYDFTLPQPTSAPPSAAVLGGPVAPSLSFPISPLLWGTAPGPATLGIGSDIAGGFVGDMVIKRVLHVIKSPADSFIRNTLQQSEPAPRVLVQRDTLQPLEGFDAWRALLPPGKQHRVLLCVHGFGSNAVSSGFASIMPQFVAGYDAVLCYEHPTITHTPLDNARDLLAQIPNDLQLAVDLVAHSRGGLVSRSLIELVDPSATFAPQRLISHGTPHEGTRLADPERWDRLISIGMTAASWLSAAAGATIWIPKVLELVLKAAAQSVFSMPGIEAMRPNSDFLQQLNAVADSSTTIGALQRRVHYAAVSSAFSVFGPQQITISQALQAMAAQAFMDQSNDLIVPTASMNAIDKAGGTLAPERQFKTNVNHFSYFQNTQVLDFLHSQLA